VEHLAEAEQLLSGSSGSGSNSGATNEERDSVVEERDSVVEATAAVDVLERSSADRSSSFDTRSEVGSDASRLHAAGAASSTDAAAASQEEDELFQVGPGTGSLSLWQRLEEAKRDNMLSSAEIQRMEADNMQSSAEIQRMEAAMESMSKGKSSEIAEMQQELIEARISAAKNMLIQKNQLGREKKELGRENLTLKRQLEASELQGAKAKSEEEIMRVNIVSMQKSIANLKARPDSSSSEDDKDDQRKRLQPADGTQGGKREDVAPAQPLRQVNVGDLRTMAAAQLQFADDPEAVSFSSSSPQLLGKQASAQRRSHRAMSSRARMKTLEAIQEPDDLESLGGSSYSGGLNVSSDAGGIGVGDLRDFEDNEVLDLIVDENEHQKEEIKNLQEAMGVEKKRVRDLEADVAAKVVRIERVTEQLELSSRKQSEIQEELDVARDSARPPHEPEPLAEPQDGPEAADAARWHAQEIKIEELTDQLNALREANRIAEGRVEDLRRALRSEETRHRREKDELMQKLQSLGNDDDDRNGETSELRERLRSTEQEKNVLVNDFEWKELQWKTQIENAQLEVDDLKRRLASEASKHQLRIEALEASAKEALEEARAPPPSPPPAPAEPALALGWLRCPVRSAGPPRVEQPAFCQETCWKVVTEISGIVALWCSVSEHVIKQASREANRLWGSSMLEGKSVFSLANGPSSASWLKKAFQSHQRIADMGQTDRGIPGFIVRDLGSETFASKNGDPFDASVITAHFAAEPGCGRPGGVLVILERLELKPALGGSAAHAAGFAEGAQPSRPRGAPSQRGHRRGDSTSSEVSSVSPSDSASNVLRFSSAW